MLFAYIGPEILMPLASVLVAILGFFITFWRKIVGFTIASYRFVTGKKNDTSLDDDDVEAESEVVVSSDKQE